MSVTSKIMTVNENVPKVYEAGYAKGIIDGSKVTAIYPKDVNFYDYEGTLLYSYTVEEAQALTELPELPTQEGLICQGWNYDLGIIKSYNRAVNVGATYITDDGKTRLYIRIASDSQKTVEVNFNQSKSDGVLIDWGDGSATETMSGTGYKTGSHTYASIGCYVINLDVVDECVVGIGGYGTNVMGPNSMTNNPRLALLKKVEIGNGMTSLPNYAFGSCYALTSVTIPNGITSIGSNAFGSCYALTSVTIPNGITSIGDYAFNNCYALTSITIPNGITSIGSNAFGSCKALTSITIPNGITSIGSSAFHSCGALTSITIPNLVTSIGSSAFQACTALNSITMPNLVTSIGSSAFYACYGIGVYDFTACLVVPTLENTNVFQYCNPTCQIRVPASLYDSWIAATNWSTYANKIVAV